MKTDRMQNEGILPGEGIFNCFQVHPSVKFATKNEMLLCHYQGVTEGHFQGVIIRAVF